MEKSAREKVPAVLALLMGMLGMTAMTVMGYLAEGDAFNPRDIATRAAMAWGVMLVLGYIVGLYSMRFLPEPPARKGSAIDVKDGEARKDGEDVAGAIPAPLPKKEEMSEGQMEETLNLLLNEPVELSAPTKSVAPSGPVAGAAGATVQAPPD